MFKSHNPQEQELDFFVSFLTHAIKGNTDYKNLVSPIISDAVGLARHEKSLYDVDRVGIDIKVLLFQHAADILNEIDVNEISAKDLSALLKAIQNFRHTALA